MVDPQLPASLGRFTGRGVVRQNAVPLSSFYSSPRSLQLSLSSFIPVFKVEFAFVFSQICSPDLSLNQSFNFLFSSL